jgi:hypothetical protein
LRCGKRSSNSQSAMSRNLIVRLDVYIGSPTVLVKP